MSLRFALLGLLAHGPRAGYDLKREFDRSAGHAWFANSSQIYPTLRALEAEGLIVEVDKDEPSRRSEYGITEEGRAELTAWLSESAAPRPRRDPFVLRVFFLDLLPPIAQYRQLVWFVEEQERFLRMCDRYRTAPPPEDDPMHWRIASMEITAAGAEAQRAWVEAEIVRLAEAHPEVAAAERARRAALGS